MSDPEYVIQAAIMAALAREPDVFPMRNTVGAGKTDSGRYQRFGLGKGSCDIVALLAPEGRWLCIEVKTETGRVSKDQEQWMTLAARFGATVGVARSVPEALSLLETARQRSGSSRSTACVPTGHAPAVEKPARPKGSTR